MAVKKKKAAAPTPIYEIPQMTAEEIRAAAAMALGAPATAAAATGVAPAAPVAPAASPEAAAAAMALGQAPTREALTGVTTNLPVIENVAPLPVDEAVQQVVKTPTSISPVFQNITDSGGTGGTPNAPGAGAGSGTPTGKTEETATQILSRVLGSVGLGDLVSAIEPLWRNTVIPSNIDANQLGFMIRDTEEYKKRFPGNKALRDANKPEYSVSEYLELERNYRNAIQGKGLPAGFYDTTEYIGKFIGNNVSVAEVGRRVDQGFRAVKEGDPEILKQLKQFYPTVDDGTLAAFFLSPEEAQPIIVSRAQAAQVGAQAVKQAGMQLTTAEAESLIQQGIETPAEAQQVFGTIGAAQDLFQAQMIGEQAVAREEQLQFGVGNVQAQQRIAQRARRRKSEFEAGGGFATGQAGVAGLGTATR